MAGALPNTAQATSQEHQGYTFALTSMTFLFFMMGFITCLNDILIPHLKNVFSLNYTQAMLIQFCFFGAYFVVSYPAGALARRLGYKWALVISLVVSAIGCLLFITAASYRVYELFLGALFILASGVTTLQVAVNPYVTVLGKPETASARLTLNQAFNSLGTTLAPTFGAMLILGAATADFTGLSQEQVTALRLSEADAVKFPYLLLASTFLVLAAVLAYLKLPDMREQDNAAAAQASQGGSAWQYRHLVLGALGLFVYVGAEVSIGSLLVNFLGEANIAGLAEADAAHYVSYYWGGAMVGRFIGSAVMRQVGAGKVLAFNALAAVLLLAAAVLGNGALAMWAVLAVGLFNSIMFPTIFSLAVKGLGHHTAQGSGILCMAIVGGAIVPLLVGVAADNLGIQLAFALPILCYLYIAFYGLKGSQTA
ncbi:sugar MFS transporter [Gallaecimonas xiamenensis]|uniref:Glucose/galactose transporter n=1 Tax=Gallaecimonas xiamenensis 3-C-1 TaxID=745411 RepID=K2J499_9GAMM|nr:sugar MFS transporter [Gallaecimonas xiamenensis]EKE77871.1 glucose/galactose transporter [Gallaecimonas xiamenensis 3-C-1]